MLASTPKLEVLRVSLIPEKVTRLQVISCDLCGAQKASYDLYAKGKVEGVPVLKRCCSSCKSLVTS